MKNKFPLLTQKLEVKVDKIYRWRGHYLIAKPFKNNTITLVCKKCFFKGKGLKCRAYCKNYFEFGYPYMYFQEINEIELLILKGDKNEI